MPINLALNTTGGIATQSSTWNNSATVGLAPEANDGNRNGKWNFDDPVAGSLSHTGYDYGAWWQVALTGAASIGKVFVFNRADHPEAGGQSRLTDGFTVTLFNGVNAVTSVFRSGAYDLDNSDTEKGFTINFGGNIGDRIQVQLASLITDDQGEHIVLRQDYLHLAEVEVYAVPLPAAAWLFISAIGSLVLVGRRRQMHGATA